MKVTVYHNPNCGTSRNVLALLRERGIEPKIVEYLKTPLDIKALTALVQKMRAPVRELIRSKEKIYADLGLGDTKWSEEELIDFVVQHPILMNRPVVETEEKARLCRPAELVLELLEE